VGGGEGGVEKLKKLGWLWGDWEKYDSEGYIIETSPKRVLGAKRRKLKECRKHSWETQGRISAISIDCIIGGGDILC